MLRDIPMISIAKLLHIRSILLFLLAIFIAFASACGGGKSGGNSADNPDSVGLTTPTNHTLLVKFNSNVAFAEQQEILKKFNLTEIQDFGFLPGLIHARVNSPRDTRNIVSALKQNTEIAYVEPDYPIVTNALVNSNTSPANKVSARNNHEADPSSAITQTANPKTIAVLDTGIDFSHENLKENRWQNPNESPRDDVDNDHNGWADDIYGWNFVEDDNFPLGISDHGTHVAGIIAGIVNQEETLPLTKNSKIVALRVLDDEGNGFVSSVLGAFDYIVENEIPLSNNSWGLKSDSQALRDALQQLAKVNHLLIVAAGNDQADIDAVPYYPASYDSSNIIAVTALTQNNELAPFANFGKNSIDFGAPGEAIVSTSLHDSFSTLSGTSMASAFVSGIALRLLTKHPDFTKNEIKTWLLSNAKTDSNLNNIAISSGAFSNLNEIVTKIAGNTGSAPPVDGGSDEPTNISISSPAPSVIIGDTLQLDITGGTPPYTWQTNNAALATIDANGLLSAFTVGSVSVFAIDSNRDQSNTLAITINSQSEDLDPPVDSDNSQPPVISLDATEVRLGNTLPIGIEDDSALFTWVTSNDSVSIENNELTALTPGNVTIWLEDNSDQKSNELSLTILPMELAPANLSEMAINERLTVSVKGGFPPFTWTILNESVASLLRDEVDSSAIEIIPLKTGITRLEVLDAQGNLAFIESLEISIPPLNVKPSAAQLNIGQQLQLDVTGGTSNYDFVSDDTSIAVVDINGQITAFNAGATTIRVIDTEQQIRLVNINVNPNLTLTSSRLILSPDETETLVVTGTNNSLQWFSSDSSILSVNSQGIVTANSVGIASISVLDSKTQQTGTIKLEVRQINITSPVQTISAGTQPIQLYASGGAAPYFWSVSDASIASVDSQGILTPLSSGIVDIIATDNSGFEATKTLTITAPPLSVNQTNVVIENGKTLALIPSGGDGFYNWQSNDETIATVNNNGVVSAIASGDTTIILTDISGQSLEIAVSVREIGINVTATNILITDSGLELMPSGGNAPYNWISDAPSIATIDANGFLTPIALGTTRITVTDANNLSASIDITVIAKPLVINPQNAIIKAGDSLQFLAAGGDDIYTWFSSNESIATVDNTGFTQGILQGSATISVADGIGQEVSANLEVRQLALSAPSNLLTVGDSPLQLNVSGGASPYTWSSSNTSIATISNDGKLTPYSEGDVTITVTDTDGIDTSQTFTINDPALSVNNNNILLAKGEDYLLAAEGGSGSYFWSSTDNNIAVVNSNGLVTAIGPGQTTIVLSDSGGQTINIYVNVRSVSISASTTTFVAGGQGTQFTAEGGLAPYSWISSNSNIVSVDSSGNITPVGPGTAIITVNDNDNFTSSIEVSVLAPLTTQESTLSLVVGNTHPIAASGGDGNYSWSSSDSSIANISSEGTVTAMATGTAIVTLTDGLGNSLTINIEVSELTISADTEVLSISDSGSQLTISGGNGPYTYTSSDPSIAAVDNSGFITPVASGVVTITAEDSSGNSVSTTIEIVNNPLTVNTANVIIAPQNTYQLSPSGGDGNFSWSSSDNNIASVSNNGLVSAIAEGIVTINLRDGSGQSVSVTVEVRNVRISASTTSLEVGQTITLSASGGAAPYSWATNNAAIATVSSNGLVTAIASGTVSVSATDSDGFAHSISLNITSPALTISQTSALMGVDSSLQLSASGGEGSLTWSSSNPSVASVDSNGLVTAESAGSAVITVRDTLGNNRTTNIEVRQINLTASSQTLTIGAGNVQISATGGTSPYTWVSNNPSIATVDSSGRVTGISPGIVTITATDADGFSASISISVNVTALALNQSSALLSPGGTIQLTVSGGDGNYTWTSNNTGVATVDNDGNISANSVGVATITVRDGLGTSRSASIEVRQVTLSANTTTVTVGGSPLQVSVSGGSSPYTWTSSNTSIATVNSNGQVSGVLEGNISITATDSDGFSGSINLTVVVPQLSVNQSTLLLEAGDSYSLNASGGNGNYTWSSSNNTVATVSSQGQVSANSAGVAIITVRDGLGNQQTTDIEVRAVTLTTNSSTLEVGAGSLQISVAGGASPYSWSSSNTNVATVDSNGRVTGRTAGNVTISATDVDGFRGSINLTITVPPLSLSTSSDLLGVGDSVRLSVSGGDGNYNWSSSNSNVASVDSSGRVTANSTGTTSIRVEDGLGNNRSVTIEVREVTLSASTTSITVGAGTLQINASGSAAPYSWSSSNTDVATVDSSGRVTARTAGSVTISATDVDGFRGSINLTITVPPLSLSTSSDLLAIGDSIRLSVSGGDGNYSWSSSNSNVASVDSSGRVTANRAGTASIRVEDGLGNNRSVTIEVREVTLSASTTSITVGAGTLQINASGGAAPYSWSSSNSSIASVSSSGVVTPNAAGDVTITARDSDGFEGSISITVNPAPTGGGGGGGGHGGM